MASFSPVFGRLPPGLTRASEALPGAVRLAELPLTALVGVTGVGKSTVLAALAGAQPPITLLPDRRLVTDAVMIAPAGGPVTDREARFALTARYRETHPGGMAQALGELALDPARWPAPLLFDGLRGADEVGYAAEHFSTWRFAALHAPDPVRVRRLLGRADRFDQVQTGEAGDLHAALLALPGVAGVFRPDDLAQLAALSTQGRDPAEVLAKTRIVLSERRHYDPDAARAILAHLPAHRALDLDTVQLPPAEVAARLLEWL